jgi:endonuclease/exonuclease/phosphatase family metal-dependent hydrolase
VPELTVASFNIHWGRGRRGDGWPEFDVVEACSSLDADLLVLQESWAPDGDPAQHDQVAAALGMEVVAVPMARAVMQPAPKLVSRADPERGAGAGDWCLAVLSRKPIRTTQVTYLHHLPFDPWTRVLVETEIDVDGTNLTTVATHFSHLEFGSVLQAGALRRALPPADRPGVFVGDMNMWGWTISTMVPTGWRHAVQGKTWPSHRPHHQIDHVLVTPSVEVVHGEVLPHSGSDHRAIRARLRVR